MQSLLNLCHCTSMERHLDKRSLLFFFFGLHPCAGCSNSSKTIETVTQTTTTTGARRTQDRRQLRVESREAISLGRRLGCYCLPISEQLSPERGCGLSLLIMPLPKAKGKVPKKQRTSSLCCHAGEKLFAQARQVQGQGRGAAETDASSKV